MKERDKVPLKKHPFEIEIESCRGKIAKVGGEEKLAKNR